MKCEVCGTKIPIGSHECPQCGYKWKDDHINTFDVSSVKHDHIRVEGVHQESKPYFSKKRNQNDFPKWFYIAVMGVIIAIILSVAVPFIITRFQLSHYENMSFTQLIDNGYDDTSVVSQAKEDEENALDFFRNELKLEDVDVEENSYKDGNDLMDLSFEVTGQKNATTYGIKYQYDNNKVTMHEMFTMGKTQSSLRYKDTQEFDEDILLSIGNYIKIYSVTSQMEKARLLMKNEGNHYMYTESINDINIYMTEEIKPSKSSSGVYYEYYCSVYKEYNE